MAPPSPIHKDSLISPGQPLPSAGRTPFVHPLLTPTDPPVTLWDFQDDFVGIILGRHTAGQDRGLLVSPTGSGKSTSYLAASIALIRRWQDEIQFAQGLRPTDDWVPGNWRRIGALLSKMTPPTGVLFVTHRDVGVEQASALFSESFGNDAVGILQGKRQEVDRPIIVATAQTLLGAQHLIDRNRIGLVIVDEGHHYVPENEWADILRHMGFLSTEGTIHGNWPRLLIAGTATPDRLTGSPLRNVYGPEGLVQALDARELWERPDRILLRPEVISVQMDTPINTISGASLGKTLAELFYNTLHRGESFHHTVVYVNAVAQIADVVTTLNDLGITAVGIHGETPDQDREIIWERFRSGEIRVLVNVGVVGEILNIPSVEVVALAFASESRSRVVQDIGRAMRRDPMNPDKRPLVVDMGGNVGRHRLDIRIREVYEMAPSGKWFEREEDTAGIPRPRDPNADAVVKEVNAVTLAGDLPVTPKVSDAIRGLGVIDTDIQRAAYHMGIPSDILFAYANNIRVPASLDEVIEVAQALGDADEKIRDAWAREKVAQMERANPFPEGLTPARRAWAELMRWGFWFRYGGAAQRVSGFVPSTVREILDGAVIMGGHEIWEQHALRAIETLLPEGRFAQGIDVTHAVLAEINYPPLGEWMRGASLREILINRLVGLGMQLGRAPTVEDMDAAKGMSSAATYGREFDSWNMALAAAGLEANHRTRDRAVLIKDLKKLAQDLGRTPTVEDMDAAKGMASAMTYQKEFGSWNKALAVAGLGINREKGVIRTREELIADLKKLARELGRTPTAADMNATKGMAAAVTYQKEFGSWNKALAVAGLGINQEKGVIRTREELIEDLQRLARELGRTPTAADMNATKGMAAERTYRNEFDSWNKALAVAGFKINQVMTQKTRAELIADLKELAKSLRRTPRARDMDAAEGMASAATYQKEFDSWNKALAAAGLKRNRSGPKVKPSPSERGFALVEANPILLPLTLTAYGTKAVVTGARQFLNAHPRVRTVLGGGLNFTFSDLASDVLLKDWDKLRHVTAGTLVKTYAVMSAGNAAGEAVSAALFSRTPLRYLSSAAKGFGGHVLSLASAIGLMQVVETGRVEPKELAVGSANILASSLVVKGATTALADLGILSRLQQGAAMIGMGARATGLTGVAISGVMNFLGFKVLGRVECAASQFHTEQSLHIRLEQLLTRDRELLGGMQDGEPALDALSAVETELKQLESDAAQLAMQQRQAAMLQEHAQHEETLRRLATVVDDSGDGHSRSVPMTLRERENRAMRASLIQRQKQLLAEMDAAEAHREEHIQFKRIPVEVTLPKKTSAKLTAVELPTGDGEVRLVDDATLVRRLRYARLGTLSDQIQDYRRQRQRWIKPHSSTPQVPNPQSSEPDHRVAWK